MVKCPHCPHIACPCGWCHCTGKPNGIYVTQQARQSSGKRLSDEEWDKIARQHLKYVRDADRRRVILSELNKRKKLKKEIKVVV